MSDLPERTSGNVYLVVDEEAYIQGQARFEAIEDSEGNPVDPDSHPFHILTPGRFIADSKYHMPLRTLEIVDPR